MENKKKSKRFFQPEFKADAVKLVESSSRSVSQIARELDVSEGTLRAWVRKSSDSGSKEKPLSPEDEIKQLKKEMEELRQEKEILKRFSAFWVKETSGR